MIFKNKLYQLLQRNHSQISYILKWCTFVFFLSVYLCISVKRKNLSKISIFWAGPFVDSTFYSGHSHTTVYAVNLYIYCSRDFVQLLHSLRSTFDLNSLAWFRTKTMMSKHFFQYIFHSEIISLAWNSKLLRSIEL